MNGFENRISVYRWDSVNEKWSEYKAWFDEPKVVTFSVNDGLVPGSRGHLPSDEFWAMFTTMPRWGIVDRTSEGRLWIPGNHDTYKFYCTRTRHLAGDWKTREDAMKHLGWLRNEAKNDPIRLKGLEVVEVVHLPVVEQEEVSKIARKLELFVKTVGDTHRILRGEFGDRSVSGAANIDNMVANRWQIAWEVVHGIRPMPESEDLYLIDEERRHDLRNECNDHYFEILADRRITITDSHSWLFTDHEKTGWHEYHDFGRMNVIVEGHDEPGKIVVQYKPGETDIVKAWFEGPTGDKIELQ